MIERVLLVTVLFLLSSSQTSTGNRIVDLLTSLRHRHNDDNRSTDNFVTDFRDIVQTIQQHLYNASLPNCLPGFHSYAGSCYFLSPIPADWLTASNICSMKRNSSLVSLETNDELEFVVEKLLKRDGANQAFIGLYATDVGQWHWLDGRTFWDSIFGPLFYIYRPDTSRCGLLNLVNGTKPAIEGRDCQTDKVRFVCKYVENHCYAKYACGRGGECMNFGLTFRCRCNFLFRGRRCEKWSSRTIQSIIALVIMGLMGLTVLCLKCDIFTHIQSCIKSQPNDNDFSEHENIISPQKRHSNNGLLIEA